MLPQFVLFHIKSQMIYERKAKDVSVEKKKEVLTALWDATSGLGEVTCTLFTVDVLTVGLVNLLSMTL